VPLGLGASYTTLSEQAHGVGLNKQNPGQYTGSTTTNASTPESMAQLQAYLQQLKISFDKSTNAGTGIPAAYQNHVSPSVGAPYPTSYQNYTPPTGNTPQDEWHSELRNWILGPGIDKSRPPWEKDW